MPLYTYRCPHGHRWHLTRPMSERHGPSRCPECGARGTLALTAPHLAWYPGAPRPPFKR